MKLGWRIWIENDEGQAFFGDGRAALLEAIEASGTLSKAAKEVGMAYRTAWGHVRSMEEGFGKTLLNRRTGGKDGGATTLTPDAIHLLKQYHKFKKKIEAVKNKQFEICFGE